MAPSDHANAPAAIACDLATGNMQIAAANPQSVHNPRHNWPALPDQDVDVCEFGCYIHIEDRCVFC